MEPIEDILDFRKAHSHEYRAYARAVQRFVREIGLLPTEERAGALRERQEEVKDMAHDLRGMSAGAWGRAATFTFGLTGAVWLAHQGDAIGAVLAAGVASGSLMADNRDTAGVYTYLFHARQRYG